MGNQHKKIKGYRDLSKAERALILTGVDEMKFRKKPAVIDAKQWDGTAKCATTIIDWILESGSRSARYHGPEEFGDCGSKKYLPPKIAIDTFEGTITASPNDFIIQGVQGEFYPCKPDIFAKTYDAVDA